ncbi:hypothetical protein SAMN02982989_2667 [Xaviernesmea oryzae]|uniref:DUF680 domain-containing protein n=1 Tax=Xaviernesmea oryzae TaxID=464029 RepID=A0A1X7FC53_9HYPH|nr:hypothetical protein [Xaviernesmea oryzae]SMF49759.1 hypothetical protein SAMN02982989_2667 [Xaviernesmea oryzae]
MKTITSALAAALIASASFAGAAFAEGDYYEGVSKAPAVDHVQTGSVAQNGQQHAQAISVPVEDGDYYAGANRPN